MPAVDQTLRDQLTETFENRALYDNGSAGSTPPEPFYADKSLPGGATLYNFGFGFNISANGTSAIITAADDMLAAGQLS
jgi:hypothetical protein